MATYRQHRYPGIRAAPQPGTFTIDFMDHSGRRRQVSYHGTESDANKHRHAILAKVNRIKAGLEAPPKAGATVRTLFDLWELFRQDRQKKVDGGSMMQTSLDRYQNSVNALFDSRPALRGRPIEKVFSSDFEDFKAYRKDNGFSPEGINTNLRNLRSIFNFAVKKGLLGTSPLADVARLITNSADVRFLEEDEIVILFEILGSLDLENEYQRDARDLTLFYLFTGARTSEILYPVFTWKHDLDNSIRFPRTKFSKSRSIPKSDTLREVLEGRKHIQGGPFFTTFDGGLRITRDVVYNRVKFVMQTAGLDDVSTHDLRRTAGVWYYMATRDIFAASRFLGHSSVKVTESHYAGLIQSLQVEYTRMFEDTLWKQASGNLQLTCNFEGKPGQSRVIEKLEESPVKP